MKYVIVYSDGSKNTVENPSLAEALFAADTYKGRTPSIGQYYCELPKGPVCPSCHLRGVIFKHNYLIWECIHCATFEIGDAQTPDETRVKNALMLRMPPFALVREYWRLEASERRD